MARGFMNLVAPEKATPSGFPSGEHRDQGHDPATRAQQAAGGLQGSGRIREMFDHCIEGDQIEGTGRQLDLLQQAPEGLQAEPFPGDTQGAFIRLQDGAFETGLLEKPGSVPRPSPTSSIRPPRSWVIRMT